MVPESSVPEVSEDATLGGNMSLSSLAGNFGLGDASAQGSDREEPTAKDEAPAEGKGTDAGGAETADRSDFGITLELDEVISSNPRPLAIIL